MYHYFTNKFKLPIPYPTNPVNFKTVLEEQVFRISAKLSFLSQNLVMIVWYSVLELISDLKFTVIALSTCKFVVSTYSETFLVIRHFDVYLKSG